MLKDIANFIYLLILLLGGLISILNIRNFSINKIISVCLTIQTMELIFEEAKQAYQKIN